MQYDIPKLCADALRAFAKDKYDVKLKSAHAHELVAAYLGYRSKNALVADDKYPIGNLGQAEIAVMTSDEFVDQRRKTLQGLSPELPDSYTLGEAVYAPLFSDEWWTSPYPPFRDYKALAKALVENSDSYQSTFKTLGDFPVDHFVIDKPQEGALVLAVIHSHQTSDEQVWGDGRTTITLPRIAGHVGFGKPEVWVERWAAGARRRLDSLGVQP